MNRLNIALILTVVCTVFNCVGTSFVFAADEVPFPEVLPIEKNENAIDELKDVFPLAEQLFGSNQDDAYLHRIHNDAYYHLVAYSDNGDRVQLHDASTWSVHPSMQNTVLGWVQSHDLFIKPKSSCFSTYKYVLYNRNYQQAVEVNLIKSPLPMGGNTFRIVNIEPFARLVQLSDNTVWYIDPQDNNFSYWQIGQRIMIGVNNHWHTTTFPNILINVDLYNEPYSQADFYGYPVSY